MTDDNRDNVQVIIPNSLIPQFVRNTQALADIYAIVTRALCEHGNDTETLIKIAEICEKCGAR